MSEEPISYIHVSEYLAREGRLHGLVLVLDAETRRLRGKYKHEHKWKLHYTDVAFKQIDKNRELQAVLDTKMDELTMMIVERDKLKAELKNCKELMKGDFDLLQKQEKEISAWKKKYWKRKKEIHT